MQNKKNCDKNQEKNNFLLTCKIDEIDSYSYGDQIDSESDDWEHFSNFKDSKVISDISHDD